MAKEGIIIQKTNKEYIHDHQRRICSILSTSHRQTLKCLIWSDGNFYQTIEECGFHIPYRRVDVKEVGHHSLEEKLYFLTDMLTRGSLNEEEIITKILRSHFSKRSFDAYARVRQNHGPRGPNRFAHSTIECTLYKINSEKKPLKSEADDD
jgi:hypothetical protein